MTVPNPAEEPTTYPAGYAQGLVEGVARGQGFAPRPHPDVVTAAVEALDAFYADTPEQATILLSMWSRRAELDGAGFAEVLTALYGTDEVDTALISLWARVDQLTAAEVAAVKAMLHDDQGLAERFLEERNAEDGPSGSAMADTQ